MITIHMTFRERGGYGDYTLHETFVSEALALEFLAGYINVAEITITAMTITRIEGTNV